MKISILSIGKWANSSPEKTLFEEYKKRLSWSLTLLEFKNEQNKEKEGERLLTRLPEKAFLIALDEKRKKFSSTDLATQINTWQLAGISHLCFIIGGADGLSDQIKKKADLLFSLSDLTFPHFMVRVILAEQLYRAESILQNHPYHRE